MRLHLFFCPVAKLLRCSYEVVVRMLQCASVRVFAVVALHRREWFSTLKQFNSINYED